MDCALHNNSSLPPILFAIVASFVELPIVDVVIYSAIVDVFRVFAELILWTGRASESCTAAPYEPLLTLQIGAYCPVDFARFDKEVAISLAFQFENL